MTDGQSLTLLDQLLRRRMWTYARFAREYRKAADRIGLPSRPPEERQLKRWRAARVERPRSAACEVLEEMFGVPVPELLAPPRPSALLTPARAYEATVLRSAPGPAVRPQRAVRAPGPGPDPQPDAGPDPGPDPAPGAAAVGGTAAEVVAGPEGGTGAREGAGAGPAATRGAGTEPGTVPGPEAGDAGETAGAGPGGGARERAGSRRGAAAGPGRRRSGEAPPDPVAPPGVGTWAGLPEAAAPWTGPPAVGPDGRLSVHRPFLTPGRHRSGPPGRAATRPVVEGEIVPMPMAAEALTWSRELERTDVGPGTLEHLEAAVDQVCGRYGELPAAEALPVARHYRRQVARLLGGRHTLREGRALARAGGLLSVALAWLAHDLGDTAAAEAYCLDARLHGEHAELPEVCAWAEDCRATIALYDERPQDALQAALRGRSRAPGGTAAEIRLTAQVARASARAGRLDGFELAMTEARAAQRRLPAHAAGLFSADAARIDSFEASGARMLGRPDRAARAATAALEHYRAAAPGPDGRHRSPTRLAIALLDLAGAHAACGDLDAALASGEEALSGGRPAEAIRVRGRQLASALLARDPRSPQVRAFADRLRASAPG